MISCSRGIWKNLSPMVNGWSPPRKGLSGTLSKQMELSELSRTLCIMFWTLKVFVVADTSKGMGQGLGLILLDIV